MPATIEIVPGQNPLALLDRLVAVIEATVRSAVSIDSKVGDVAGCLKIVRPVEVEADGIGSEPEIGSGKAQHECVTGNFEGDIAPEGGPDPPIGGGRVAGEGGCGCANSIQVKGIVVSLPAGRMVLIRIDEQDHPVAPGSAGDVRSALGKEVEIGLVPCDFEQCEIVPSGGVGVDAVLLDGGGKIARDRVIGGIEEGCCHVGPIAEVPAHVNGLWRTAGRNRTRAFALAILTHHLEIIVVGVASLHRFDVPVVFLIVFVHEIETVRRAGLSQHINCAR